MVSNNYPEHSWTNLANPSRNKDTLRDRHIIFFGGRVVILTVYVNDIILTEDDFPEMDRLKKGFAFEFEIKDLGSLKYFLGMEVARSNQGIMVSQRKYILDLLN